MVPHRDDRSVSRPLTVQLKFGDVLIASDDLALGRVGSGAVLNNDTILDVFQYFRAQDSVVVSRGDGPDQFGIKVWALFTTEADALAFFLSHRRTLPLQDDLTILDDADVALFTMSDAARSVKMLQRAGAAVLVEYVFTGSHFEAET